MTSADTQEIHYDSSPYFDFYNYYLCACLLACLSRFGAPW